MTALLFGSLSTVADTSELQRDAFNRAFAQHGLDWHWDRESYRSMLRSSGGEQRIGAYAAGRGQQVDAAAVHRTKSELFQAALRDTKVQPRDGVVDTVRAAKQAGVKLAFVTGTSPENVEALLSQLRPALARDDFDLVLDGSSIRAAKPDPAAYTEALARLHETPQDCVAVEDNVAGVHAATAAGVRCVAFPNANTVTQHFPTAVRRVDRLDLVELTTGLPS